MTKTIEQARREAFELFVIGQGLDCEFDDMRNCYSVFACHFAWQAYNAALDSLCIDLPAKFDPIYDRGRSGMYAEDEARDKAIDDCREAIHAAGVKTR